ncbi:MAG: nitroreductase [Bacteroidetes bacterium]|nr:nitroreductase [Bacteroidota bacterium]
MNRRNFIAFAGATIVVAGGVYYLSTDKKNFVRADIKDEWTGGISIKEDERTILQLASLAPSGHNTQPWFVKYIEPYHWIIGSDKSKWLLAVDPTQRETMLSIGAFLQNIEYAAGNFGYSCQFTVLATSNQDEDIAEVKFIKTYNSETFDIQKIKERRTIRSNYLADILKKEDVAYLTTDEYDFIRYIPNSAKEHQWLNEQTIEANRIQTCRDDAEKELAEWIRFSSKDAKVHCDGLTLASMEIEGIAAWYLRNFYGKADVMKNSFREKSVDSVIEQVSSSAGWLLITSKDNSVVTLLETGKRLQRLLLKIRERNIAIHPMTQILEEKATSQTIHSYIGVNDNVQFILRAGYVKSYPQPVSLRRPVNRFLRKI